MFEASRPSLLLEYFRVPYRLGDAGEGIRADRGAALLWPAEDGLLPTAERQLEGIPLRCRVLSDARADLDDSWRREAPVLDADGERIASVWRHADGSVFLPFDPDEAIETLWSERYQEGGFGRKKLALRAYYRVRPLLPRALQIALRRRFARIQARRRFPRWPVEPALHDLYRFLLERLAEVAGRPVPTIAPWPDGRTWAVVLTHDVETDEGYRAIHLLRDAEERTGFRSSWNLVPKRYDVADEVVANLQERGFEVGVHGLYHDGRDLDALDERLPEMRTWAERWRATGFRSPATHRDWTKMPLLGFDYDSSYPDTDPFEPQSGGCCSLLPFFNDGMVELPITLPQDHTLFVILGHRDERAWVEKAAAVKAAGGMALLITHPDYMLEPRLVELYERFLGPLAADESAWRALPREVSAWWRRRAASSLEPNGDGWKVVGPAAGEARVDVIG